MLKRLGDWLAGYIFLVRDTNENKQAIRQLEEELGDLAVVVQKLAEELRFISEREKNEREKLVLQLENALLKMERRLPAAPKVTRKKR